VAPPRTAADVLPGMQGGALVPPDPVLLRILVSGLALSAVGFFLPWYYVSYTPPDGSVRVAGQVLTKFSYSYSGISPEHGGLLDFSLAGYSFGEQVVSGAAMTGVIRVALLTVFIATLLSIPGLAGLTSRVLRVLRLKIVMYPVHVAHTVALVIEAMGAFSFLLLGIGLGHFGMQTMVAQSLGGSPAATQAASYLHINLGDGFWLVLIGLLIVIGAIAKRFFTTLVILIVGVIILSFVHSAWILAFVHQLGF
jgi:hypothetical protein